jgi:hypothetical protein
MPNDLETVMARLDEFSDRAFEIAKAHREAGREKGLAFDHFGRYVSCLQGIKSLIFTFNITGSREDFADIYIQSLPKNLLSAAKGNEINLARAYIKETHHAFRFLIFHNFYSQTETTFRIIQRKLFPKLGRGNMFELMAKKYGILEGKVPHFLSDVRNTIHNNGYHFPLYGEDKNTEYIFLGKRFKFVRGRAIYNVDMHDILAINNYLLEETKKLFDNEVVASINLK